MKNYLLIALIIIAVILILPGPNEQGEIPSNTIPTEIPTIPSPTIQIKDEIIEEETQPIEEETLPEEPIILGTFIDVPPQYKVKDFKSYENYKNITSKTSPHYKLQHEYAYTDEYGLRLVNGRYCIAVGSYFTTTIGQYMDIVLENGVIIPCVLGDQKADKHTDILNIAHPDGSVVEFIVDLNTLVYDAKIRGNVSYCHEEWKSPVVQIILYDINVFGDI